MSEWISVEDRLPEADTDVAFVVDAKGRLNYEYMHGYVLGGRFHFLAGQATFSVPGMGFKATHWMPLPEPPSAQCSDHVDRG